ncbi:SKA complex subunit 3 [Vanacampus margaritifer]
MAVAALKMDPKLEFFAKLKKLCGTLETETAGLQQTIENRHDSDATAKAMRAYHDFNCDVLGLKGELQDKLSQQKTHKTEVDTFIQACRALQTKVAHDVCTLTDHFENYGYQAPTDARAPHAKSGTLEDKESAENVSGKGHDDDDDDDDEEEEEEEEEEVAVECCKLPTPPQATAPSNCAVPMHTPKLSDFGLCELYLRRNISAYRQPPAMPKLSLPRLDVPTPLPPTPKCALRMDEDEVHTPQMIDFGLSEDTMSLYTEFTMDLFRKNADIRPAQDLLKPPDPILSESPQKEDILKSPEPPVFCTPGFKIKTNGHCSPPPVAEGDAQSPSGANQLPDTPKTPDLKTPSLKRLLSSKKHKPKVAERTDSHSIPFLKTPIDSSACDQNAWEYNVPELRIPGVQGSVDSDGSTQDFHLSPPRVKRELFEISTPEMPDLSAITQDICKLVMQSQKPAKRAEHKSRCMSAVSKQEFDSLPAFMKQITLNNLNQAVHNINQYLDQCPERGMRELETEELKNMMDVGIKTPVYMLCLNELRRLEHVEGSRRDAIYKLNLCS